MRIVSWNMRKNKNAWDYFFNSLNPDIALLQETSPLNDNHQFNVITKNVKKNLNNSILFKKNEPQELPIEDSQKMGLISSRYQTEDEDLFLLSVYGNLSFVGTLDFVLLETIEHFSKAIFCMFLASILNVA